MTQKLEMNLETEFAELRNVALAEAAKVLRRRAGTSIEDVAQTAVTQYLVYASREQVRIPGATIRTIANRVASKHLKAWKKRRADLHIDPIGHIEGEHLGEAVDLPAPGTRVSARLSRRDDKEQIAAAVGQLAPVDQRIAHLSYLTDPPLPAPAIAERVALTPGSVRNHLVAIRRTLRELLESEAA